LEGTVQVQLRQRGAKPQPLRNGRGARRLDAAALRISALRAGAATVEVQLLQLREVLQARANGCGPSMSQRVVSEGQTALRT
jgi:hypothetical protein